MSCASDGRWSYERVEGPESSWLSAQKHTLIVRPGSAAQALCIKNLRYHTYMRNHNLRNAHRDILHIINEWTCIYINGLKRNLITVICLMRAFKHAGVHIRFRSGIHKPFKDLSF